MPLDSLKNKKICIIYGGWSEEREISLMSGQAVYDVLKGSDYEVFILDLKNNKQMLSEFVNNNSIDIIFNLIHGKGGEDGLVQSWIEDLKIDYVGSNSVSSSTSFSKITTKKIWAEQKLRTPDFITSTELLNYLCDDKDSNITELKTEINKKCEVFFENNHKFVFKPSCSGSSVGIQIYDDLNLLLNDKKGILSNNTSEYLIEAFINGSEYTAPIINGKVLPIIKIETKREFYNYEAKYLDDNTSFSFPEFSTEQELSIKEVCLKAFESLNCRGWGRVDFFIDKDINLIEINTIPGMTSHSLVPMSAKHLGMSYLQLVEELLINAKK